MQLAQPLTSASAHAAGSTSFSVGAEAVVASAAAHAPAFKPIITPLPVINAYANPLGLYPLQATASSVTVSWYSTSSSAQGFEVFERDDWGNWQKVYQVPASAGTNNYSWIDTSTGQSGQCYRVAAYNSTSTSYTNEECTVRPDPSRFPQALPAGVAQIWWSGLSDTNDGTGPLVNWATNQNVRYADQTFGVNLTFANSSLWRVEAQGGPHLMKGQAVALKVWGGGWLKYGHETFGVDLQLSATPVYQWYVIGGGNKPSEELTADAGEDLTAGVTYALWNSSAQAYLASGYQTWGISLTWYKPGSGPAPTPTPAPAQHGVKTEQVLNCSVDQDPVEVFIADQTSGSGFVDLGGLDAQYYEGVSCPAVGSVPITFTPQSGHQYLLVATDSALSTCDGTNDPQEAGCIKMEARFVGDANGFTRTDIVDDGAVITP
jgi:hypothetical protein